MKIGAFFDMDRTLLTESSTLLMVRYMRRRQLLQRREVMWLMWARVRLKLGLADIPTITRQMVQSMAGSPEAEQVAFARRWFQEQLIHYVSEVGRHRVADHRARGHRLAVITGSPVYTADPLAQHLEISSEDVLATRFEVEGGRFTGRLVEPMCYQEGKLAYAQAYANRHGLDLSASYFYTDSIDDLSLLERVGHPVAVNPDSALLKLAQERAWPVVSFY